MKKSMLFPFHLPKQFSPAHEYDTTESKDTDQFDILLIEEDDKFVTMIHELIKMKEKDRWRLFHVETLSSALERLKEAHYDVVVLDLYLPDASGLETLEKFVSLHPGLPIVIMTGIADEKVANEAIRDGAQDYLVKGQFTSDYFIRSVQYAVERKKLDQLRDELTSYMNHEISNPLSMIKDSLKQLSSGDLGPVNSDQEQFLKLSLSGIDRLVTITDDVLLCTKLELGKLPIIRERMNLSAVTRDIINMYKPAFDQRQVTLKLRVPLVDVYISADKERITQIMTNLISNALKHTPPNGVVKVKVLRDGDEAGFSVSDTGSGIPEKEMPKLFKKYEHGFSGNGNGQNNHGTGLGLYICRTLTELHGGHIHARSREGLGTKFTVMLPANSSRGNTDTHSNH